MWIKQSNIGLRDETTWEEREEQHRATLSKPSFTRLPLSLINVPCLTDKNAYEQEAGRYEQAYRIALNSLRFTHPGPLTAYMVWALY